MKGKILFIGDGVYEPHITHDGLIVWLCNYDNDPLFGVRVASEANAETFADLWPANWSVRQRIIDGEMLRKEV